MTCSHCTPVLYLAPPGTRRVRSKPAVAFPLKRSEGSFGAGSLSLPSSETAHRAKAAQLSGAPHPRETGDGSAEVLHAGRAGSRGGCKRCVSAVPPLPGDVRGVEEKWSLSGTRSSKGLVELPPYNVSKASWTSPSRTVTPETELPGSHLCMELNISKAGFTTP